MHTQKKYKEHEKLFKNWPINNYSSKYHLARKKIKRVYVIEYNLERVFRDGARSFVEYKDPLGGEGRSFEEFYQFFWACVQMTWGRITGGKETKEKAPSNKKRGGDTKKKNGKKKKKKSNSLADDEAEEGEEEEEGEEGEKGEEDEGINDGSRGGRGGGFGGAGRFSSDRRLASDLGGDRDEDSLIRPRGGAGGSWRPPPVGEGREFEPLSSDNYGDEGDDNSAEIEGYIEAVLADREKVDQSSKGAAGICDGICGYRVWILVRGDETLETSQASIMKENVKKFRENPPPKPGSDAHEKYKKIINNTDLAVLAGMYTNNSGFSDQVNRLNDPATPVLSGENPVSASCIFSLLTAFMHCDKRAVDMQGPLNWDNYCAMNTESASYTITFPLPEYVMRLYMDQCTVEAMSSKYFPHIQKMGFHPIVSKFPGYFPSLVLSPSHQSWKKNKKNQLDRLADEVGKMNVGDDRMEDEGSRQDDEEARQEDETSVHHAKWRDALIGMAEKMNFPHFDKIVNMNPFDQNDLTLRQRLKDLHDFIGSSSMHAYHRSELACLAEEGAKVKDEIVKIYQQALAEIEIMADDPRTAPQLTKQSASLPDDIRMMGPEHHLNAKICLQRKALHRARVMYLFHQNYMFDQYGKRCRSADSDISEIGKVMHSFREEEALYEKPDVKHYKIDRRLGTFANAMIRMLKQYEHVYLISDKHLYAFVIELFSLDAYRHAFNLHANVFTYSVEGGQGKSYLWEFLKDIRIPGTCSFISYQTLRAQNVDGDQNDMIKVFNEMPSSMFIEQQGKNDDAAAALKENLTSMNVQTMMFNSQKMKDTGMRSNRIAVSECIGVTMGSTNLEVSKVSPAMKSRFHWLNCEPRGEPRRTIQDLLFAQGMNGIGEGVMRDRTNREKKLIQMIFFEVEKLIQIGALTAPTMDGCRILFTLVEHELSQEGHTMSHGRKCERDLIMAGILAKLDAIDRHYFTPGGEYFGKPITLESMKGLDRKLVGFAHHAVFALGLTIDQVTNAVEDEVLHAVKEFHRTDTRFQDTFRMFRADSPDSHNGANVYNHNYRPGGNNAFPPQQPPGRVNLTYNSPYMPDRSENESGKMTNKESWDKDYNYITFMSQSTAKTNSMFEFAGMLSGFMDSGTLGNRIKPSISAIMSVLRNLQRKTYSCKDHIRPSGEEEVPASLLDDSGTATGTRKIKRSIPPDTVVEDPKSSAKHRMVCIEDRTSVSFLWAYLNKPEENGKQKITRILSKILNTRHQVKRTVAMGMMEHEANNIMCMETFGTDNPDDPQLPHMKYPNTLYMDEVSRVIIYGSADGPNVPESAKRQFTVMNTDIDTYAIKIRNEQLYVSPYRVDPSALATGESMPTSEELAAKVAENRDSRNNDRRPHGGPHPNQCFFLGKNVGEVYNNAIRMEEMTPRRNVRDLAGIKLEVFDGTKPDYDMGDLSHYEVDSRFIDPQKRSWRSLGKGGDQQRQDGPPPKNIMHWTALQKQGNAAVLPHVYKMYSEYPCYTNDKESYWDYESRHTFNYPEDMIKSFGSRKEIWTASRDLLSSRASYADALKNHPEYFVDDLPSKSASKYMQHCLHQNDAAVKNLPPIPKLPYSKQKRDALRQKNADKEKKAGAGDHDDTEFQRKMKRAEMEDISQRLGESMDADPMQEEKEEEDPDLNSGGEEEEEEEEDEEDEEEEEKEKEKASGGQKKSKVKDNKTKKKKKNGEKSRLHPDSIDTTGGKKYEYGKIQKKAELVMNGEIPKVRSQFLDNEKGKVSKGGSSQRTKNNKTHARGDMDLMNKKNLRIMNEDSVNVG